MCYKRVAQHPLGALAQLLPTERAPATSPTQPLWTGQGATASGLGLRPGFGAVLAESL